MSELLLELFSEEIPARMQVEGLPKTWSASSPEGCARRASPSRAPTRIPVPGGWCWLFAACRNCPRPFVKNAKGRALAPPEKAVEGFLRSAGLDSLEQCETRKDAKGEYYVAVVERPGETAQSIIARLVPDVIQKFPWPKSQRWGAGRLRWVRPLHSILCLLDGKLVPFEVDGVESWRRNAGPPCSRRPGGACRNSTTSMIMLANSKAPM